jgi:hypothetical protein
MGLPRGLHIIPSGLKSAGFTPIIHVLIICREISVFA